MSLEIFINNCPLEFFESEERLQQMLDEAILQEDYLKAAAIRDEFARRKSSCHGVSTDFIITD